jgi:hypothetical protein
MAAAFAGTMRNARARLLQLTQLGSDALQPAQGLILRQDQFKVGAGERPRRFI